MCHGSEEMQQIKPDGSSLKFTAFSGVKYVIEAYANTPGGQRFAKPIQIPESGNVKGLKIMITSTARD